MSKISAVIITYNEEKNIERCLMSLNRVVDEIVIVDAFSEDRTLEIAREFTRQIFQREWQGYAGAKNFGNKMASHDYILSIDADEALSESLGQAILSVKSNLKGVYAFNRLTNYCGQWIRYSGWYPDKKIRLFNKQTVYWKNLRVHEALVLGGDTPVTHLKGDLLHYSITSISDHIKRANHYSDLAAQTSTGQSGVLMLKLLFSPIVKFVRGYFIRRGFLDGFYGFCICFVSAFFVFVRYAKVFQHRRNNDGSTEGDIESDKNS